MLPLTTTTVTVTRPAVDTDPYEAQTIRSVTGTVACHISTRGRRTSGGRAQIGGSIEDAAATLYANPGADLRHGDWVLDAATGYRWLVDMVEERHELGLGHLRCRLARTDGAADG